MYTHMTYLINELNTPSTFLIILFDWATDRWTYFWLHHHRPVLLLVGALMTRCFDTNIRLRKTRSHFSTLSVGAKESVPMFSCTIFDQPNNSSIQQWLHQDCYLLSKKLSIRKIWQALPVAQWASKATCIQGGDVALQGTRKHYATRTSETNT